MFKYILCSLLSSTVYCQAQNQTCPTRPFGTNDNSCASTAYVQANVLPITSLKLINSSLTDVSQTVFFPSFDGNSYPGGHSILLSYSASAASMGGALIAQAQNAAGTANNGAMAGLVGGWFNQRTGAGDTDGGGVLGYVANSASVPKSVGAAIWGITRQSSGIGSGNFVTALRASSESDDHPYAGLFIFNFPVSGPNSFVNGAVIASATGYGYRVGITAGEGAPNANYDTPTHPFSFFSHTGSELYYVDSLGQVVSAAQLINGNLQVNAGATGLGIGPSASTWLAIGASTTALANFNLPATGVAPSSPNNGDFWFDGTNFLYRVGGATQMFAASATAGASATVTVRDSAGTGTCTLIFTNGVKTGGTC